MSLLFHNRARTIYDLLQYRIFFNSILRSMIQSYLKLSVATFLALTVITFNSSQETANSMLSLLVFLVLLGFPPFTIIFLSKNLLAMREETFQKRFSSIFLNLDIYGSLQFLSSASKMVFLYLLRRLVMALTIVQFSQYTFVQIFTQIMWSTGIIFFYGKVQPLNEPLLNQLEIFNEGTILICLYFNLLFSEIGSTPGQKYQLGWILIGIISVNIVVNWVLLLKRVVTMVFQTIKEKWEKVKIHQAKKEPVQSIDRTNTKLEKTKLDVSKSVDHIPKEEGVFVESEIEQQEIIKKSQGPTKYLTPIGTQKQTPTPLKSAFKQGSYSSIFTFPKPNTNLQQRFDPQVIETKDKFTIEAVQNQEFISKTQLLQQSPVVTELLPHQQHRNLNLTPNILTGAYYQDMLPHQQEDHDPYRYYATSGILPHQQKEELQVTNPKDQPYKSLLAEYVERRRNIGEQFNMLNF
ncbi:hypothetical protein FGO68_gene16816 [Halteria grandinella]|uniref:Transmembrane protein n=1 Tax=Halteria grandinella TaxID=5974 RepID=A0A8J8P253_HALGN|nr:hypothetical protein FGO68_gene16816 [Halteria grandinella]